MYSNFLKKHSIKRLIKDLIFIIIAFQLIIAIFSLASFISEPNYLIDLLVHFKFQYFIFSLCALPVFLILKRWWLLSLAILCLLINGYDLYPYYNAPKQIKSKSSFKVGLFNIYTQNPAKLKFIQQLYDLNPDIVVLQEVNQEWWSILTQTKDHYPFHIKHTREDNFGIALLSKFPIENYKLINNDRETPWITAKLKLEEQFIQIVALHPPPPIDQANFKIRNKMLSDAEKEFGESSTKYTILMGDLNITPWSYYYKRMLKSGMFVEASKGFGYNGTWPSNIYPLKIPIDHIMISNNLNVKSFNKHLIQGSDHYGLISYIE